MIKITLLTFCIFFYCLSFSQTRMVNDQDYKYFVTWKTNEAGETEKDSIIQLLVGTEVPEAWIGRVYYVDEDGNNVSPDGKYAYFYREDEKTGELFKDSVEISSKSNSED